MAKFTKTNKAIHHDGTIDFTDNQSMGTNRLTTMDDGIDDTDAVNVQQLNTKVSKAGDSMTTGTGLDMNNQRLYGLQDGDSGGEAVHYGQFSNSHGINGYQTLPGGLMFQWGRANAIDIAYKRGYSISFPQTFSVVYNIQAIGSRTCSTNGGALFDPDGSYPAAGGAAFQGTGSNAPNEQTVYATVDYGTLTTSNVKVVLTESNSQVISIGYIYWFATGLA